ncbi:MAG: hypothetical protein KIS79_09945 [Burkholderiales bacterium]|nr:hypothetical protein [Burkholderiales bacterium]
MAGHAQPPEKRPPDTSDAQKDPPRQPRLQGIAEPSAFTRAGLLARFSEHERSLREAHGIDEELPLAARLSDAFWWYYNHWEPRVPQKSEAPDLRRQKTAIDRELAKQDLPGHSRERLNRSSQQVEDRLTEITQGRGRPANFAVETLLLELIDIYEKGVGQKASVSRNSITGVVVGPLFRFVMAVLAAAPKPLSMSEIAIGQALCRALKKKHKPQKSGRH